MCLILASEPLCFIFENQGIDRHKPEVRPWQEGRLADNGDNEGDGGEDDGVGGGPGGSQSPGLQAHDAHRLARSRLFLLHHPPEMRD